MVSVVMDDCSRECVPYDGQSLYHPQGCVPFNGHHLHGDLLLCQNLGFLDYDSYPIPLAQVTLFLSYLVSLVRG